MPRFGVQAATFAQRWNRPGALRALDAAAHLGFDALEIPLLRLGVVDVPALRAGAQKAGMRLICRTALPPNCSVLEHAERARVFLGQALREAQALGAESLGGALLYAPGAMGPAATPGDGALLVEVLADLAQDAAARGVLLALEPAHRFESSIVNSVAQALAVVHAVGGDKVLLSLSTLQLHIGEANLSEALRLAAAHLYSVRVVENTGGPLGSGAVQWDALWHTLATLKFDGLLLLDAPQPHPDEDAFGSGAQLSRVVPGMELYPEEYAAEGLAFLQQGMLGRAAAAQSTLPPAAKGAASTQRSSARRSKGAATANVDAAASTSASPKQSAPNTSSSKTTPRGVAPKPSGAKSYRSR